MHPKVLLISPSGVTEVASGSSVNPRSASPPLGLLYIAAVLLEKGYSVEVLDMNCDSVRTRDELAERLRASRPDLIGISTLTPTFRNVVDIADVCGNELPDSPIVLGGYFATFCHDKILSKYDCFDFVVRGEGEETAAELLGEFERSRPDFSRVRGLTYRDNGRIVANDERPLMEDLNSLPFPAYHLVSHLRYGSFGGMRITSRPLGALLTSRGCPYKCRFCSCSAFTHSTIRWRSPEKVVEELDYFNDRYRLDEFMVVDDIFTFNKKHVLGICRLIKEHGLDLEWYCEGRVNQADESMFREMYGAGCRAIYLGIESCVDRILRYYRKGLTYDMARDAAKKARRAGLDVIGSFILGAPIETVEEMWETVRKAGELDIDFAKFNVLRIVRGMPIWEELVEQGVIDEERQWEENIMGFDVNPEVAGMDSQKLLRDFHRAFYLRRRYVVRQVIRTLLYRRKQLILNLRRPKSFVGELKETVHLQ